MAKKALKKQKKSKQTAGEMVSSLKKRVKNLRAQLKNMGKELSRAHEDREALVDQVNASQNHNYMID